MNTLKALAFRAAMFLQRARVCFRGLIVIAFFLLAAGSVRAQQQDLFLNPGSNYVDVGRGIPWGSLFNRTYVLVPNSPNSSVCVYVVNNNPTNQHTFSLAVYQSADPRVNNYSSNTGRFQTVPSIGTISPVAANSMTSAFVTSTAAAEIAIAFSGSSAAGGSPDTADLFLVQTSSGSCGSASTSNQVQGTTTVGATVTGNPVLIGGKDNAGNARFAQVAPATTTLTSLDSFPIGGGTSSGGGTVSNVKFPAGSNDGPLAVIPFFIVAGSTSSSAVIKTNQGGDCNPNGPVRTSCRAIIVADSGFIIEQQVTITATNQTIPLWASPGGGNSVVMTCHFSLSTINLAGTTPTLDVWLQDSPDNTNWDDRIHFVQATTGTLKQTAGIAGMNANNPVAAITNKTLAASTIVSGPLDAYGQLIFTIAGTASPSYTVDILANCK